MLSSIEYHYIVSTRHVSSIVRSIQERPSIWLYQGQRIHGRRIGPRKDGGMDRQETGSMASGELTRGSSVLQEGTKVMEDNV